MKTHPFKLLFLLSFAFTLCLSNQALAAEAGQNCEFDLGGDVPADVDWREVYMIRGDDGYVWQRAIVSGPNADLVLQEGKPFNINGSADPLAETQIYMFSANLDDGGKVKKPAQSTCISGGKADKDGFFAIPVNARVVWDRVGSNMMIDAFFRLDKLWEQQFGEKTNQNYYIATHLPLASVNLKASQDIPEGCTTLCQGYEGSSGLQQVVILDPVKYPEVAGMNFTPTKDGPVALGKFGQTWYAGTKEKQNGNQSELAQLTMKTMTIEVLKQFMLGIRGMDPTNVMTTISKENIEAAAAGTQFSPAVQQLVQAVQKTLVNAVGSPERDAGLKYLTSIIQNEIKCLPPTCMTPSQQTMFEIFPAGRPGTDWAYDFLDILLLWTSKLDPNKCILDENQISKELEKNFYDQGWHHNLIIDCSWYMTYTHGYSSPAIVIHGVKPVTLTPKHKGIRIMTVDRQFDTSNSWKLGAGKKTPILYRFETRLPVEADYGKASCVKKDELEDYADFLGGKLSLRADEIEVMKNELQAELSEEGFYSIKTADPEDIAARFNWELDGEKADIFQLFFDAENAACDSSYFAEPETNLLNEAATPRDGFETGFVN